MCLFVSWGATDSNLHEIKTTTHVSSALQQTAVPSHVFVFSASNPIGCLPDVPPGARLLLLRQTHLTPTPHAVQPLVDGPGPPGVVTAAVTAARRLSRRAVVVVVVVSGFVCQSFPLALAAATVEGVLGYQGR